MNIAEHEQKMEWVVLSLLLFFAVGISSLWAYPLDGYEASGIRRLKRLELAAAGKLNGPEMVPGARRSVKEIQLGLAGRNGPVEKWAVNEPELQRRIDALFPDRHESYALMVVDVSPGRTPRWAARQPDRSFSPGSVGKLVIAAGLFAELQNLYPGEPQKRMDLMQRRMVTAEKWIHTDSHSVPIFNPDTLFYEARPIREGDVFSLYEWVDHMLSASANSAASTVWKEVLLMRRFGRDYPVSSETEARFFETTEKQVLQKMAMSVVNDPLRKIGISPSDWQLGSFFTATGKKIVPPGEKSVATPRGMMHFLVEMEKGLLVDEWSSLELKRLMYMTARRIRFASSPALTEAAVYYKSGSLYKCQPEEGFRCEKYKGNVENVMNSVAIVEQPDGRVYFVTLMSNILRRNSAVEHQTIATQIDRILR